MSKLKYLENTRNDFLEGFSKIVVDKNLG